MRVYFLIDRSGSMASRWDEALGAVNSYMKTLAEGKGGKKIKATVAVLDGGGGSDFNVLRQSQPVSEWKDLTSADATPRGMTPLFDAIGKMVACVDADDPKKAVVAVMTDGHENASREVTKDSARAMFDRLRGRGYQVVFLGADFDAFGQAASVGTMSGQTISMSAGNYANVAKSLATHTRAYAATGATMSWSDEDRKKAAGR